MLIKCRNGVFVVKENVDAVAIQGGNKLVIATAGNPHFYLYDEYNTSTEAEENLNKLIQLFGGIQKL